MINGNRCIVQIMQPNRSHTAIARTKNDLNIGVSRCSHSTDSGFIRHFFVRFTWRSLKHIDVVWIKDGMKLSIRSGDFTIRRNRNVINFPIVHVWIRDINTMESTIFVPDIDHTRNRIKTSWEGSRRTCNTCIEEKFPDEQIFFCRGIETDNKHSLSRHIGKQSPCALQSVVFSPVFTPPDNTATGTISLSTMTFVIIASG